MNAFVAAAAAVENIPKPEKNDLPSVGKIDAPAAVNPKFALPFDPSPHSPSLLSQI